MRYLLFFVFANCLLPTAHCFSQDIKFSRIGSEQGLSQASVNCILQDSKGFMWFGTQDGLNKFNGYEMMVYKHDPSDSNSLSNNYIDCLFEDSKGIIWVGTRGGGLNAINPFIDRVTRFENDAKDEKSISNNQVKCIYEDRNGVYWIATNHGLNSFNGKDNNFEKYIPKAEDTLSLTGFKVETIYEDKKGRLWIGTYDGGLNLFDREKKIFSCYRDHSKGKGAEFFNRITSVAEDASGIFWIATDNGGLAAFNPEKKKFIQRFRDTATAIGNYSSPIIDNKISSLSFDKRGTLWIGTKNNGLKIGRAHV